MGLDDDLRPDQRTAVSERPAEQLPEQPCPGTVEWLRGLTLTSWAEALEKKRAAMEVLGGTDQSRGVG
jgi:hypothetical protein